MLRWLGAGGFAEWCMAQYVFLREGWHIPDEEYAGAVIVRSGYVVNIARAVRLLPFLNNVAVFINPTAKRNYPV